VIPVDLGNSVQLQALTSYGFGGVSLSDYNHRQNIFSLGWK